MKNRKLIAIIAFVVGLIIAGGLLTLNFIQLKQTAQVYITSEKINAGAQITTDEIKSKKMLKTDIDDTYITNPNQIVNKYATVDLVSGDVITKSKVSDTAVSTDNQFLSIPSGRQAISFSVSGGSDSVSNKLKVGDIIRIYSYDNQTRAVESPNSLKYVRVANITSSTYQDVENNGNNGNTSSSSSTDDVPSYSTITVIVYSNQAQELIRIQKAGSPYVTLLSRGNETVAEKLLNEQEKLLKK